MDDSTKGLLIFAAGLALLVWFVCWIYWSSKNEALQDENEKLKIENTLPSFPEYYCEALMVDGSRIRLGVLESIVRTGWREYYVDSSKDRAHKRAESIGKDGFTHSDIHYPAHRIASVVVMPVNGKEAEPASNA